MAAVAMLALFASPAMAQPSRVVHADIDYAASGFVAPAGMIAPHLNPTSPMAAGFPGPGGQMGPVDPMGPHGTYAAISQVAHSQRVHECGNPACDGHSCGGGAPMMMMGASPYGCDSYGCDSAGCDSAGCGMGGCGCNHGGIIGKLHSGEYDASTFCLFCRGNGCGVCKSRFNCGALMGLFGALLPHQEAGLGAQRWYDLSAEALFLGHHGAQAGGGVVTRQGVGLAAPAVLSFSDIGSTDLEAGIRLSAAMIMGPGGNLEVTYMGGHEWDDSASATGPNNLFSFVSNFGTLGGLAFFDDTDQSFRQTVSSSSKFHSGELNYRRRTVGPYQRFQGSWLVGLRYLRFDEDFGYSALGPNNNAQANNLPRFFRLNDGNENSMFGAQIGFDFWWNVMAGVNFGTGLKGAWLNNNIDRDVSILANSLGPGATVGAETASRGTNDNTVMVEFETRLIYRISHSWSFQSAFYTIAVDDVSYGAADGQFIRDLAQGNNPEPDFNFQDLVLTGFSVGAEYVW